MDPHPYSAKQVGDEFARQYYQILQNSPENISLLYKDNSKISRPGLDGTMRVFTLSDVDENDLKMQSSGGFDSVEVTSVTSQDSNEKGIAVAVYGYFTFNERPARNFTQSFFLAPQEKGYFVLTDMFKFVDIPEANDVIEEKVPETEEAALRVSENVPKLSYASVVMKEIRIGQGQHFSSCDYSPEIKPINGNSRESQMVSEGAAICVKNLPLYATIALVKNALKQFGEIRRGGVKVRSTKYYEGQYAYVEFEEADAANRAIMASPLSIDGYRIYLEKKQPYYKNIKADAGDDTGNGNSQESQGKKFEEAGGICVQNLPPNATIALVERVFKQFGQIKKGRIQVRNPAKSNYWYAFVEFEEADAAERAIKASPLNIDGYTTDVEKKRPYYRKSGYCESPSAGPGNIHRGEGMRGTEVNDLHNWQKIMDQSEEQMKFQEEQGRQHNQNRYTSEEVRGTEGVVGHSYSAKQVGDEFARQYYQTLQNSPDNLYTFYKDNSTISRPGLDGTMRVFTLSDVDENDLKIQSSDGFDSVVITSVTSQDSREQGILVAVYGYFTFNERPAKHFTQSVFLAPQEDGYFVLTDMFKFVDIPEANAAIPSANDVTEEKVPETEEAALRVSEPSQGFEKVPKLSHASVVSGHSNHQHFSSCGYSPEIKPRNGNSQESQAVAEASIYLTWLPTKATVALVENAFTQFGKIRRGGVDIRNKKYYKGNYAFVEFEEEEAANRAIMASPLSIFGYRIPVQKKRSYYNGYGESPFVAGPGNIHRGEGVRGSLGNPFCNWQKMMEEVRGTDVWQKLMMGSRGTEVYDLHNWQKIMDQSEEQMKFQEEQGRQHNQNRYTSEEVRGTEEFGLEEEENQNWETLTEEQRKIQEEEGRQYNQNRYRSEEVRGTEGVGLEEEENQNWEKLTEEERKIQEEEGRQYNQNRYTREQMKETRGVGEEVRGTEAHEANNASKLQEEAGQTEVDHSWDSEQIMEEQEEESKLNLTSYVEDIEAFYLGVL